MQADIKIWWADNGWEIPMYQPAYVGDTNIVEIDDYH